MLILSLYPYDLFAHIDVFETCRWNNGSWHKQFNQPGSHIIHVNFMPDNALETPSAGSGGLNVRRSEPSKLAQYRTTANYSSNKLEILGVLR
jgi:hypothetical protein